MKLSEAIRENKLPQIRNAFFELDEKEEISGVCALGGALMNADIETFMDCAKSGVDMRVIKFNEALQSMFPILSIVSQATHPITGTHLSVHSIIVNLNDTHGWTREQIADWVKSIDF